VCSAKGNHFSTIKGFPTDILATFLQMHGLSSGYCALHMDQGRILWPSQSICKIAMQAVYHLEPTGSDAISENGKVEHLDGIFALMLQSLLHGAGLPAQFFQPHWSIVST